jgi:transposase
MVTIHSLAQVCKSRFTLWMDRDALKKLSPDELVELVLKLQRPALTSRTSSKPPSSDRKAKRSGSKPGGAKPGHKGHSRALSEHPDETITHRPGECAKCGQPFAAGPQGRVIAEPETIDLPPIRPIVTRHQRLACACGACGHQTKAAPLAQGSPFGPNI